MKIVYYIDENYKELAKSSISLFRKWNPNARIIVVSETTIIKTVGY